MRASERVEDTSVSLATLRGFEVRIVARTMVACKLPDFLYLEVRRAQLSLADCLVTGSAPATHTAQGVSDGEGRQRGSVRAFP